MDVLTERERVCCAAAARLMRQSEVLLLCIFILFFFSAALVCRLGQIKRCTLPANSSESSYALKLTLWSLVLLLFFSFSRKNGVNVCSCVTEKGRGYHN